MITILEKKPNELGVFSSILCIIHCLITPFVLVVIPSSSMMTKGGDSYDWWLWLDVLFLIISFVAVFKATQQSKQMWMKISMALSWIILSFFVFNERLDGIKFSLDLVYFPAVALTVLHLLNRRKCRCEEGCCEKNI